ncbi:MAG: molybdenum cofactor guanylyltransferase [Actinomycetes bacterium]
MSPPRVEPVTGILLVGGASRRFGSPKALARFGDETLAERAWRLLGEAFGERIAVGKADELDLPFPVLDDRADVRAPLAGIVAGLRAVRSPVAVVIPVDCPLLEPADLRLLAAACGDADAATVASGPLPGAYAQSSLPTLERCLRNGTLKIRDVLEGLDVRLVEIAPARLANANTPAELASLQE